MSLDLSDVRSTIVPKSDQLNAEQLLGGPMTIRVTDVRAGSDEQPIVIHYEGDNGRPYKPGKTARKVLIFAWGEDARKWVGRWMVLYNEPTVKFGGEAVGGIRISHLSDIERDISVSLTATKGKKALHSIKRMAPPPTTDYIAEVKAATTVDDLRSVFRAGYRAAADEATKTNLKAAYDARMAELTKDAA